MNDSEFWLLSAGKDGELWPAFWLESKIAVGWSALGDLRSFSSRDVLWQEVEKTWPDWKTGKQKNAVSQIWRFYKEIRTGDVVFVRSSVALLGIAIVDSDYDFIEGNDPLREKFYSPYFDDYFPHVRSVRWVSLGRGMKQPLTFTKLTVL